MVFDIAKALNAVGVAADCEVVPRKSIPFGATYCRDVACRICLNLFRKKLLNLVFVGLDRVRPELSFATGCSGADSPSLGIIAFFDVLMHFGIDTGITRRL